MSDVTQIQQDRYTQRLRLLSSVFNKIDRIMMMDRKVQVRFIHQPGTSYPGWSLYPNIFINVAHFKELGNARTIVQLLGLNYHEMGHLMFTPRAVSEWLDPDHKRAWNILEDQRMESFFTAQYKPAGKYFTEMIVRFMVDDQKVWASAFPYTYGRTYLPLEIRDEFESRFKLKDETERIKELIDQYKTFKAYHFRSKQKVVKSVVEEFHLILLRLEANVPSLPTMACEDGDQPKNDASASPGKNDIDEEREKEAARKERRQREKEDESGEDQSGFWEDDEEEDEEDDDEPQDEGEDGGDSDDGDDGHSAGDDDDEDGDEDASDYGDSESDDGGDSSEPEDEDAEGDGDGGRSDESDSDGDDSSGSDVGGDDDADDGDEDGSAGDGDSDSDDSEDDDLDDEDYEGGAGTGDDGPESAFTDEELSSYLDEIEDAVNDDEAVENEVRQILQTVNDPSNTDVIDFPDEVRNLPKEPVNAGMSASVKSMQLELRKLHAEIDPGWHYGSDVGRLNVDRAMRDPENYEELYDEWWEGREHETGLEVIILLDISGSMMSNFGRRGVRAGEPPLIEPASQALWCIKAALDDVDAKVTVLGFSSGLIGLSSREEKFSRTAFTEFRVGGGGTMPAQAFHVSRRLFTVSEMPNKLLVIVTDGEWSNMDPSDPTGSADLPALIEGIDAVKMYIHVGNAGDNPLAKEKCQVVKKFSNPLDLVPAVQRVVLSLLARRR